MSDEPVILYTRRTCPAENLYVRMYSTPITLDGEVIYHADGKPVMASDLIEGKAYEVKTK